MIGLLLFPSICVAVVLLPLLYSLDPRKRIVNHGFRSPRPQWQHCENARWCPIELYPRLSTFLSYVHTPYPFSIFLLCDKSFISLHPLSRTGYYGHFDDGEAPVF